MPTALDHYRFALEAPLGDFDPGAVLLGTQGPDPFYFSRIFAPRIAPPETRARKTADFMHDADPSQVFLPIAAAVAALPPARRGVAASFLYGLMLHYLLDRRYHPYVYYRTGFDSEGRALGRFMVDHSRFESSMAEKSAAAAGESPDSDPRVLYEADPETLAAADELLAAAYPDRLERGDYSASWRDMARLMSLLHARSPWYRAFLRALAFFVPMAGTMARPSLFRDREDLDCLNEGRSEWLHPVSGESSRESVAELRARALADASPAAELVRSVSDGHPADWAALFGGLNHEGYAAGERMRVFESAYGVNRGAH